MNSNVQEPSAAERHKGRYTGFPEPLSLDRNTTLPHPEADTSPGCTLEGAAMLARTHSRVSVRRTKNSRTTSKGSIRTQNSGGYHGKSQEGLVLDPNDMYKGIEYADGTRESGNTAVIGPGHIVDSQEKSSDILPTDSGVALGHSGTRGSSDTEVGREGEGRKKGGLLRKLQRRKD